MELKKGVKDLLEEMVCNTCLLPAEHKAAASILRVLTKEEEGSKMKVDLNDLLMPPTVGSQYCIPIPTALQVINDLLMPPTVGSQYCIPIPTAQVISTTFCCHLQ